MSDGEESVRPSPGHDGLGLAGVPQYHLESDPDQGGDESDAVPIFCSFVPSFPFSPCFVGVLFCCASCFVLFLSWHDTPWRVGGQEATQPEDDPEALAFVDGRANEDGSATEECQQPAQAGRKRGRKPRQPSKKPRKSTTPKVVKTEQDNDGYATEMDEKDDAANKSGPVEVVLSAWEIHQLPSILFPCFFFCFLGRKT